MAETHTADEVKQRYVAQMGPELGEVFHAVYTDLVWTHWRWKQYRILFGETPTRVDLINRAAPFFFYVLSRMLLEDTLMSIAKMVAAPKSYGRDNLSLMRLPPLIADKQLRVDVERLIGDAKAKAAFAEDWRNRHIAHRDLALALQKNAQPLLPASRANVEAALLALRKVLDKIELAYCDSTTFYDAPTHHDAETLLYVIRDGLRLRDEKMARLKSGKLLPEDFRHEDPL